MAKSLRTLRFIAGGTLSAWSEGLERLSKVILPKADRHPAMKTTEEIDRELA